MRCNAVAPGLIWSRFVAKYEEQFKPLVEETPLRRFGTSEDIVEAIAFLASDRRAGFITGEALNVSGPVEVKCELHVVGSDGHAILPSHICPQVDRPGTKVRGVLPTSG